MRRRRWLGAAPLLPLSLAACRPASRPAKAAGGPSSPEPAPAPRSLLILGGTGFLGPHVVEVARARGYAITLFNRGRTNPHLFPDLEKIVGDRDGGLHDLLVEVQGGRRWTGVVDTSGYVPRVVRDSVKLLGPACERYVFVSTISVYVDLAAPGIDEDHAVGKPPDPRSEAVTNETYGPLKAACEREVAGILAERGLVVRPGLIVGPGDPTDRFTYWVDRATRAGPMLAPGAPGDPAQWIDARDLAEFMVHAVDAAVGGTLNVVGPVPAVTIGGLIDACVRRGGGVARPVWAPAAALAELGVQPWVDMPVWVPPLGEEGGLTRVSSARAIAAGLRFRGVDDTVAATHAWWSGLPAERRSKLRAGLAATREAEVLAALGG